MYMLNIIEERELLEMVSKWCAANSIDGLHVTIRKETGERIYLAPDRMDQLEEKIADLEDDISDLETERDNLQYENEALKDRIQELEKDIKE